MTMPSLPASSLIDRAPAAGRGYRFFGVSVFGVPEDDLVAVSAAVRAIRIRPSFVLPDALHFGLQGSK